MRKLPAIIFIVVAVMMYSFLANSEFYGLGLAERNRLSFTLLVWITMGLLVFYAIVRQNKKQ